MKLPRATANRRRELRRELRQTALGGVGAAMVLGLAAVPAGLWWLGPILACAVVVICRAAERVWT